MKAIEFYEYFKEGKSLYEYNEEEFILDFFESIFPYIDYMGFITFPKDKILIIGLDYDHCLDGKGKRFNYEIFETPIDTTIFLKENNKKVATFRMTARGNNKQNLYNLIKNILEDEKQNISS